MGASSMVRTVRSYAILSDSPDREIRTGSRVAQQTAAATARSFAVRRPAVANLPESGRGEQRGEGGKQQLTRLLRAEAKISAQRLPERPDADRVQRVDKLLPLLAGQLGEFPHENGLEFRLRPRDHLRLVAPQLLGGRLVYPRGPPGGGHLLQDMTALADEQADSRGQRLIRLDLLHQGQQDL